MTAWQEVKTIDVDIKDLPMKKGDFEWQLIGGEVLDRDNDE